MFKTVTKTIEDMLKAGWTATKIDFDNVEFKPKAGDPFVRLQIEWVESVSNVTRSRGMGYLNLSIFYPCNKGTEIVNDYADQLSALYSRISVGQLKFGEGKTQRIGQQETWYRLDVIVPFIYDKCY